MIKIVNQAVMLGARDLHFTLDSNTGLIIINLREGVIMLPHSRITPYEYKQILDYIDTATEFEFMYKPTYRKSYQKELKDGLGKLKIKDSQNDLECSVSIMQIDRFRSLILRIKKPHIKVRDLERHLYDFASRLFQFHK